MSQLLPSIDLQTSSEYPELYVRMVSCASLVYAIAAFGLSGIPGIARLALYSAILLLLLLSLYIGKLKIPSWLLIPFLFYAYLVLPALALKEMPFDKLGTLTTVLIGTTSIGLALQNKILSYKVLTYGTIIATITNITAIHFGMETSRHSIELGRLSGLLANANALAISMSLTAFLIWLFPERFSRSVRMFGIFLVFYGMYMSGSRKGVLMTAALLLLIFMNYIVKLNRVKILAYITAITASMLVFYEVLAGIAATYSTHILAIDRFLKAFSKHDASLTNRLSMIDVGLSLWEKSPIFGYGLNQFASLSEFDTYAHNNFIELAVSGGVIAMILYYSMHFAILRNAMRQPQGFRLRLIVFISAIFVMDAALVSFYSKEVMCVLGVLLAVSSEEQISEEDFDVKEGNDHAT